MGKIISKNIKSISFLWIGSFIGSGSTLLMYILIARYLGAEQFGLFSSSFSIISVLAMVAGLGLPQVLLKYFGEEGREAIRWVFASLKLAFYILIFVLFVLGVSLSFGVGELMTRKMLSWFSIYIIGQVINDFVSVKFQLEERYVTLAIWQLMPSLIRLLLFVVVVYLLNISITVLNVVYLYVFVSFCLILLGSSQIYQLVKNRLKLVGHKDVIHDKIITAKLKNAFLNTLPYGLGGIFSFVYLQSDIVMLKYMLGDEQAGVYNIGFIVISAMLMFPTVLYSKFLIPKIHRWVNQDVDKFYKVYKLGNILMLVLALVFVIGVFIFSDFFIPLIFGKQYLDSVFLLKILSISLPFSFLSYSFGSVLVTKNYMKDKVKLMGGVAFLNIGLNIVLIKVYSTLGASIATVVSNIVLFSCYLYVTRKKLSIIKNKNIS